MTSGPLSAKRFPPYGQNL